MLAQIPVHPLGFEAEIDMVEDVIVIRHDILQGQGVSLFVGIDGIGDKDILRSFAQSPKMHQDFICYIPLCDTSCVRNECKSASPILISYHML